MPYHHRAFFAVALSAAALVAAACGGSGGGASTADRPPRTVEVEMVDIGFTPETIDVAKGETVRFVFANVGKVQHEAYVGAAHEQMAHEAEMKEGGMGGGHGAHGGGGTDDSKVTVEPGDTGEIETAFEQAGTYEIGCHEPGHYQAGMKITVRVA